MTKHLSFILLLVSLWLLLSGHFEPLMLGLAVLSISITLLLAHRMNVVDHESHPVHIQRRLIKFWLFLSKEIFMANLDVVRRILTPSLPISPQMITIPIPQHTDLGRVIYANSITLTPGTVSVRLLDDSLVVHALSQETAQDLLTMRLAHQVPEDSQDANR